MARRAPVSNQTAATIPIFAPDPHGWSMVNALNTRLLRGTSGREGRVVIDPNPGFAGYGQTGQSFRGAGNIGGTPPVLSPVTNLEQARSVPVTDPVLQILAERTARGR